MVTRRTPVFAVGLVSLVLGACDAILGIGAPIIPDAATPPAKDAGHEATTHDAKPAAPDAMDAGHRDATVDANKDVDDADARVEAADAGLDGCTPGSQRCSDASGVILTCGPGRTWNQSWACQSAICVLGSCAGIGDEGTSCQVPGDGITNCGADAATTSCCTSAEIPGGTFWRSYTNQGTDAGAYNLDWPATVSGFTLDEFDVTVGRFREFVGVVRADGGVPAPGDGKHLHLNDHQGLLVTLQVAPDGGSVYEPGWQSSYDEYIDPTDTNLAGCSPYSTWTSSPGPNERRPINCVTWAEAFAFCIWDGGFLPSRAELVYASAGGSEQREYPWGSAPPGTDNEYAIYGDSEKHCYYPTGMLTSCPEAGVGAIAPVGTASKGVGKWGQYDLVGEVWQLTAEMAPGGAGPFGGPPFEGAPCVNCGYFGATGNRLENGSAFTLWGADLAVGDANFFAMGARVFDSGFRCARLP